MAQRTSTPVRQRLHLRADTGASPPAGPDDLEQALLDWLEEGRWSDVVEAGQGWTIPTTQLLGAVSRSRRPLGEASARLLGVPAETPIGDVATELVVAVRDPVGPRCRSYRSAVLYLGELHALEAALADVD